MVRYFMHAFAERWLACSALDALSRLDDHHLDDIGLSRQDLHRFALENPRRRQVA